MTSYTITIDDEDREETPLMPWTANIVDQDGEPLTQCGFGATALLALVGVLDSLESEVREFGVDLVSAEARSRAAHPAGKGR